jgi:7,8-dihydropterin-6-yl-methyl-4-(beta-D-ribofuranosyl)aminobenzene 5'-phosphate synthase
MPASFPEKFRNDVAEKGGKPRDVQEFRQIADHVWTTGEMGDNIIEQSLVIESSGGLIVLTGCAHPGIESIVRKSMAERDDDVLLVMGGFHLLRTGADSVEDIAREFKDMKVKYAAPTHCSGDGTIKIFKNVFGDNFIPAGAGKVIHTAEL